MFLIELPSKLLCAKNIFKWTPETFSIDPSLQNKSDNKEEPKISKTRILGIAVYDKMIEKKAYVNSVYKIAIQPN